MSDAQAEIGGVAKGTDNPFFKSKYADLHACREAVREVFGRHGISVIQDLQGDVSTGGVARCTTMLCHKGGAWIESTAECRVRDGGPQAMGSGWTYLRRYQLAAVAGLAQTDDDGNSNQVVPTPCDSDALYDSAKIVDEFINDGVFDNWVIKLKGKTPRELSASEAIKLTGWLNKDKSEWPTKMLDTLAQCMKEDGIHGS